MRNSENAFTFLKDDITKNIKIFEAECSDRGDWRSTVSSLILTRLTICSEEEEYCTRHHAVTTTYLTAVKVGSSIFYSYIE